MLSARLEAGQGVRRLRTLVSWYKAGTITAQSPSLAPQAMSSSANPSASPDPTATPELPTSEETLTVRYWYPVTGIQDGLGPAPGQVPIRREVDEWYKDSNTIWERCLFFRAMTIFQQMPVEKQLSYYQIAGMSADQTSCRRLRSFQ